MWNRNMYKGPGGGYNKSNGGGLSTATGGGASTFPGGGLSNAPGGGLSIGPKGGMNTGPGGGLSKAPGGGLYDGPGGNLSTGPNGGLNGAPGGGMCASPTPYISNIPPWHIFIAELRKRGYNKEADLIFSKLPREYKTQFFGIASSPTENSQIFNKDIHTLRAEYKEFKKNIGEEEQVVTKRQQKQLDKLMKKFKKHGK